MNDITGTPMAVFATLLLEGRIKGPGVLAPGRVDSNEFLRIIKRFNIGAIEALDA